MEVKARLLGNPRRSFLDGIFGTVGVTRDQPPKEQLARLMDPYFQETDAFRIGQKWCERQGVSRERNTLSLIRFRDKGARVATLEWLGDDNKTQRDFSKIGFQLRQVWSY